MNILKFVTSDFILESLLELKIQVTVYTPTDIVN